MDAIRLLIEKGADINEVRREDIWSIEAVIGSEVLNPLMHAVAWQQIELVKLLLDKGVDVNVRGIQDWTPLKVAKGIGNKEIVTLLKARGAVE